MLYDDLHIFCAVASKGSFKRAAKFLNMPRSTVSRRVLALEKKLDIQLLNRTTREIRVTEEGRKLYGESNRLLHQLNLQIDRVLEEQETVFKGPVQITMPVRAGLDFLGEWLLDFAKQHPKMELKLRLSNINENLLAENIDLAFRVGPLADSTAIASRLWDIPYELVASQEFVHQYALNIYEFDINELYRLPCIIANPLTQWPFYNIKAGLTRIVPEPKVEVDDLILAAKAALNGLGIAYLPRATLNLLSDQRLLSIKSEKWTPHTRTMYAYYSASHHLPKRVSSVIEYIRRRFHDNPDV